MPCATRNSRKAFADTRLSWRAAPVALRGAQETERTHAACELNGATRQIPLRGAQ
ncbi:hypothetical protein A2U01_0067015, partial [Trifolium medium]|nr:hypothetical protein [Trifolium medium]